LIIVVWVSLFLVFYTYAGYPALIWVLSRFRPPPFTGPGAQPPRWPSVCIVVAVHNEERRIADKIRNMRELDYPADRLRLVIVSDGSTDATDGIVAASGAARLLSYQPRRGKAYAINRAVQQCDGEVIVFSDARQSLPGDALKHLVAALDQPGVGVASGELVHIDARTHQAARIGAYWRYEKLIRKAESRWWSTVGATGALYAIRRRDFRPIPDDTILDDFEIPMAIVRGGQRAVLESRAVMFDELQPDASGEGRRKLRTLSGNYQTFARNPWLFSPLHNPVWFQFVSHKAMRLVVPYALLCLFIASWFGPAPWYPAFGVLQACVYAYGIATLAHRPWRENRIGSLVAVVLELNIAAVRALWVYLSGRASPRWDKT